ncbi:MAG: peptidyl-prolyl cis-trans isomerase [Acidobacteriota bacterium]
MRLRRFLLPPVLLLLSASLLLESGCQRKPSLPPEVIVRVGDRMITIADYKHYLDRNAGADLAQIAPAAASALLDQYVEEAIISAYAAAHGEDVSAEKVAAAVRNDPGSTVMEKRDQMRRSNVVADQLVRIPAYSPEQIRAYYDQHPEQFDLQERVHARQILVHDEALANKVAEELKKGVAFEALSAEYSAAPNAQQGGDIGYVGRGQLPQVFEDELFRLRPVSISRIIKTDSGFHLFKVEDYRPAGKLDFASAEPLIKTRIREEQLNRQMADLLVRARNEIPVEVFARRLPFTYSGSLSHAEAE